MRRWRRGLAAIAALAFVLSACGSNGGGGDGQANSPTGSPGQISSTSDGKPVELKLLTRGDTWDPDNAYVPMIEQATNTKLEFQVVPNNDYDDKRNVVMASGDYPTVISITPNQAVFQKYVNDKLLLPLDDYFDKYPAVKDAFTEEELNQYRNPGDGKLYYIPRDTGMYPGILSYRKDWADQLGIAEPTTLDEYKSMLQTFKDKNPSGMKDFFPFTPNNNSLSWVDPILSAYGTPYMNWRPDTNNPQQLVFADSLPEFKDALLYLRDLRNEGLMDPNWMVTKDRGLFKFYAGQVGSTTDWPQYIDVRTEAIRKVQPEGQIAYIPSLTGPGGVAGGPIIGSPLSGYAYALTKSATPEQADAFFRMLSWQYTDGYDLMAYGIEGKTFDVVDGLKVKRGRDAVVKEDPKYDLIMLERVFFAEPPKRFAFNKDNFGQIDGADFDYVTQVLGESAQKAIHDALQYQDDPVITDNMAKIKTAVDEVATKIILDPKSDPDKVFNDYLQKLKENRLDEVSAAVNKLNPVQ